MKKIESIAEYLARGGKIQKLPEASREKEIEVTRKTTTGPATIMGLDEAELFFGEAKKTVKPKKVKSSIKIDLNVLPPALRAKFVSKLKEEVDVEGYEEEIDELDEDREEDGEN